MHCKFLLFLLIVALVGCNSDTRTGGQHVKRAAAAEDKMQASGSPDDTAMAQLEEGSEEEDSVKAHVDSFRMYCATMMTAKINLPPVYQHEIFEANDEATEKFDKLSKACNGRMKILVNSGAVVKELEETIKAVSVNQSDLLILLDRTGSMEDDMENVKKGIHEIIDTIKRNKGTRLAIAIYGDKNWDWKDTWFRFRNFETDYDAAARYVDSVHVVGNMDWPESVYDAVVKSMESDFWKSTKKRNIILVGDAPPQEKPLSDYSLDEVIAKARQLKVKMNFYPIIIMPEIHHVIRRLRIRRSIKK